MPLYHRCCMHLFCWCYFCHLPYNWHLSLNSALNHCLIKVNWIRTYEKALEQVKNLCSKKKVGFWIEYVIALIQLQFNSSHWNTVIILFWSCWLRPRSCNFSSRHGHMCKSMVHLICPRRLEDLYHFNLGSAQVCFQWTILGGSTEENNLIMKMSSLPLFPPLFLPHSALKANLIFALSILSLLGDFD